MRAYLGTQLFRFGGHSIYGGISVPFHPQRILMRAGSGGGSVFGVALFVSAGLIAAYYLLQR